VVVTGECNSVTNCATLSLTAVTTAAGLISSTNCPGTAASLKTSPSGAGPFSFQWLRNGTLLEGETNSVLNVPSLTGAEEGTYCVIVSGACNRVTNCATLTLNTHTNIAATPLTDQQVCPGLDATFQTTASGDGPFGFVWRRNGIVISGQSSRSLTINRVTAADAGIYSVEVMGICTSVTNSAVLAILTSTSVIPLEPVAACTGGSAAFETTAFGTGPFSFVWRKNGVVITGERTQRLIINPVTTGDLGIYTVEVTGSCNSVTNSAALTLSEFIGAAPLTNQIRCVCESVAFSTVVSGGGRARFVWKANGHVMEGETNSTLMMQNLKETNAGIYTVEANGPCNSVTNSAVLMLEGSLSNPLILTNPAPVLFNDLAAGSPYPSVILVKCIPGFLTRLTVTLNKIGHTFPDDMDVLLVSPWGQGLKLMSDVGGNRANGFANVVLTFDDAASNRLPDSTMVESGIYKPTDFAPTDNFAPPAPAGPYLTNLFDFTGHLPNGPWSLYVADDTRGDTGQITEGWRLYIEWDPTPPSLSAPVLLPDGRFRMTVTSVAGQTCVIEASADLQTWMPIGTNTVSGITFFVVDAQASSHAQRFYRAIRCP
jgi:hypothetical protein